MGMLVSWKNVLRAVSNCQWAACSSCFAWSAAQPAARTNWLIMTWCRSSSMFTDIAPIGALSGSAAAGGLPPSDRTRRRPRPPDPRRPAARRTSVVVRLPRPPTHKQQRGAGPCPNVRGPRVAAADWPAPLGRLLGRCGGSVRILRPAGRHCFSFCPAAPIGGGRRRGAPRHWPATVFWLVQARGWPRPGVWGGAARSDWSPVGLFELNLKTLSAS